MYTWMGVFELGTMEGLQAKGVRLVGYLDSVRVARMWV